MSRYQWSQLNKRQVGAYAEYFLKMELVMCGFDIHSTEVNHHGIDIAAKRGNSANIEIPVKSPRSQTARVFMQKSNFAV